jgi:hypothetical protein
MRLLSAVLALAALALLPMTARAETSQEAVYTPEIPGVETEKPEHTVNSTAPNTRGLGPKATPKEDGNASTKPGDEATTRSEEGPESKSDHKHRDTTAAVRGDHHDGGGSPPAEGGSSKSPPATGPEGTEQLGHGPTDVGGGSSPVLPILIALVVLATISIGVVIYRERRPTG